MDSKSGGMTGATLLQIHNPVQQYETWYEFKKDLESFCGHPIFNRIWLQIKPQTALPWDKLNMRLSLLKLKKSTGK